MGPASLLAATGMQRCVKRWDPFEGAALTRIDLGGHRLCGFKWSGSFEQGGLARGQSIESLAFGSRFGSQDRNLLVGRSVGVLRGT
jgi:hypothetical protein